MRNLLLNCSSELSKISPKTYSLMRFPLFGTQRWKISSYCWRHQTLKKQCPETPELELTWKLLPSLSTNLNNTRSYNATSKGRKPPKFLSNYDVYEPHNSHHGTTTPRMQMWHTYLSGNHQLTQVYWSLFSLYLGRHIGRTVGVDYNIPRRNNLMPNSLLSCCLDLKDLTNMREIMPDTNNLANYLELVKSWMLEENL